MQYMTLLQGCGGFIQFDKRGVEMEVITELQNLNDKIYKLAEILKRKQENEELLTVQGLLLEEIADEMRQLLIHK